MLSVVCGLVLSWKIMKTWCGNLACHYLQRISQQCSTVTVSAQARTHIRTTYLESQMAAGNFPYWLCCFEFFCSRRWWVFPHHGCSNDFARCMIEPCFILCKNTLKKLQCSRSWAICALQSEKIASQPASHVNASVTSDNNICIRQSSIVDMPGIQISCMPSTVLTVLLLSTALQHSCSHDTNIRQTLPMWHISHTYIYSHCAIRHLTTFPLDVHFSDWINM